MKKVKLSILALLAIAAVAPSCKKGEEDPMISFRGRDSRMVGEYTVSSIEENNVNNTIDRTAASGSQGAYTETINTTNTVSFDGASETSTTTTVWSTTESVPSGSPTQVSLIKKEVIAYSLEITIVKDGTYTWKKVSKSNPTSKSLTQASTPASSCGTGNAPTPFTIPGTAQEALTCDGTYNYSFAASYEDTQEGTAEWYWLDSKKNKTEINFTGGPLAGRWDVLQLKNKEIKLQQNWSNKNAGQDPNGSDSDIKNSKILTLTIK